MADRSNIGWTDATWNVVTGCSKVSTGCKNCYAEALAPRLAAMGAKGYTNLPWTPANAAANVQLHHDRLRTPLRWTRKRRRVFVNSTSDLFHEQVPDGFLDRVLAVMALAPRHSFQILTKRPQRMRDYLRNPVRRGLVDQAAFETARDQPGDDPDARNWSAIGWPLGNVWLGVSVEDQRAADERVPQLIDTPAAVRFLSCEPLLGAVDLGEFLHPEPGLIPAPDSRSVTCGHPEDYREGVNCALCHDTGYLNTTAVLHYPPSPLHWVIAGGESGPNYRPMDPQWARELRDQAAAARVPFFFKQHSARRPESDIRLDGDVVRQFPHEPS